VSLITDGIALPGKRQGKRAPGSAVLTSLLGATLALRAAHARTMAILPRLEARLRSLWP